MATGDTVNCRTYSAENLKHMFVDIVQKSRIDAGERPALRTVFHKVHGAGRRTAYDASADQRRSVNGVTLDEPSRPSPAADAAQPSPEPA